MIEDSPIRSFAWNGGGSMSSQGKMRIGIIGSGNIGSTLTRRLTALGHEVAVANSRGPQSLEALAGETGATAAEPATAGRDAELVIVAVPLKAVPTLPAGELAGKLVVDTGNYYP